MSAMQVREEFIAAEDSDFKLRSLRSARNLRALTTGGVEQRPGLLHVGEVPDAERLMEVRPADGLTFLLVFSDAALRVLDENGVQVFERLAAPWADAAAVWAVSVRSRTLIGCPTGLYALDYEDGEWSFAAFAFGTGAGEEMLQPYWSYRPGVRLKATGTSGTVTLTASSGVFRPSHVGTRIRYIEREVRITGYTSSTTVTGEVVSRLPPSYELTVGTTTHIRVGDVVQQDASGWQGIVTGVVSATLVRVATMETFEGPLVGSGERIVFPSGDTSVSAKDQIDPQFVALWDEPLISPLRGYPRSGAVAGGRLILTDFPSAPGVVAISAAGVIDDFKVGTEDDSAIVRSIAPGRILHAVGAGDLLLLADHGVYAVNTRDGNGITPQTFAPDRIDERGASAIKPAYVNDAVLYVDAGGRNVLAAMLDGSSQLRWVVQVLSAASAGVINQPVALSGPSNYALTPERYAFVRNEDGTLAAISWTESLGAEGVGFAPWDTRGKFVAITPAFTTHYAIVERVVAGVTRRFIERFADVHLDCAGQGLPTGSIAPHLAGATAAVCWNGRDSGDGVVASDGSVPGFEHVTTPAEVGLPFTVECRPWPVEEVESARAGRITARVLTFMASVQKSGPFTLRCNGIDRAVGGYSFGDLLSEFAPLRTDVFRVPVLGRRTHPDLSVVSDRPGPLRILALGQEVKG